MDALFLAICVHHNILVGQSGFFTAKHSDRWSNQRWTLSHINQISDCNNVEMDTAAAPSPGRHLAGADRRTLCRCSRAAPYTIRHLGRPHSA
ncbi:hypothetical protein CFC21_038000 [Triticum aestivum]|uniref:Uncharacterized protein n=3 Tax=Triticum TaxID=4564 RepID=A0A9R0RZH5_TRITD|nr:hypothetical protein CFC21_038000 [Triticum aestivum]VAH68744.1 unnamed protein product [Triticum turgidum subsp. durum]